MDFVVYYQRMEYHSFTSPDGTNMRMVSGVDVVDGPFKTSDEAEAYGRKVSYGSSRVIQLTAPRE